MNKNLKGLISDDDKVNEAVINLVFIYNDLLSRLERVEKIQLGECLEWCKYINGKSIARGESIALEDGKKK